MATIGEPLINATLGSGSADGALRPGNPFTPGVGGETQDAIIAELTRRLSIVEGKIDFKVPGDRVLSYIALTKEAVLIEGDRIAVVGEVTFADWQRDISGQATGVIAPSLTQVRGGVIRTERVQNFAGTAWVDLDAVGSVDFLHCGSDVSVKANGQFSFGGTGGKALVWDGANLTYGNNALLGSATVSTVVANATFGATRSVGDITAQILANSATSITMTSSQLFKTTNGIGGVFIGAGGITGKNSLGATTFAIDGASGSGLFAGDIQTNGKGIFNGVVTQTVAGSLITAAVHGNTSLGSNAGVVGFTQTSGGGGIQGHAIGNGCGVIGSSSTAGILGILGSPSRVGVRAIGDSSSIGLEANNFGSGLALSVNGRMTIDNSTLVTNLNAGFLRGHGPAVLTLLGATTSNVGATPFPVGGGAITGFINVITIDGQIGKLALFS